MVKSVLTVDDSKTLRTIIAKYLSPFSIKILEAENGEQAVARARECAPDLILLDYNMPVMDGYHALVELKTDPNLKAIPVVMVTTETEREKVVKLLKLGLRDYISKPFTREVLLDKLNPILNLYAHDSPPVAPDLKSEAKPGAESAKKIPVLFASPRANVLNLVKQYLGQSYAVAVAENGKSALSELKRNYFEFLFLDCSLPDMSAFDVFDAYARVRKDDAAGRVVALALRSAHEEIDRANELGFAAVLSEPFSEEDIREVVKLVSAQRERSRKMPHLTNHGKVCVLECPARKSSRFQPFVEAMDKIVQEIDYMAEEGLNCLVVRIGEGFLSGATVAQEFVKVMDHARKRLATVRLVVESRETREAVQSYAEIASLPKDLSLEYSLNSLK